MSIYHSRLFAGTTGKGCIAGIVDGDAKTFITTTNIKECSIAFAVEAFVVGLKADGLWNKFHALYPFVNDAATSPERATQNSYNLKDPTQYQISWGGGVTHDSNGITGGGNGYGNTGVSDNVMLQNNYSFGVYRRTEASTSTAADMGVYKVNIHIIRPRRSGDTFQAYLRTGGGYDVSNTDGRGLYIISRDNSSNADFYKNGVNVYAPAVTSEAPLDITFNVLSLNQDGVGASFFSPANLSLAFMASSMNTTESADFYTRVQTFQTALNRQV